MNLSSNLPRLSVARMSSVTGFLGLACAVHCLLTPVVIVTLPALGFLGNERLELAFIIGSIVLASINLAATYRTHRRPTALMLLVLAIALLSIGRMVSEESAERTWTSLGAIVLALSQFVNHWRCCCCRRASR